MGFDVLLFAIFLALKLSGHLDWSWWWVTSPLWISLIVTAVVVAGVSVMARKERALSRRGW